MSRGKRIAFAIFSLDLLFIAGVAGAASQSTIPLTGAVMKMLIGVVVLAATSIYMCRKED